MWTRAWMVVGTLALVSCSDGVTVVDDGCMAGPLPLSGADNAPTVTDVGLEIQPDEGVIVFATATDPQGSENLADVVQTVGVFPDIGCNGTPVEIQDELVGSGVEETFGTAVSAVDDAALVQAISAASSWPVEVEFSDVDGNVTAGPVMARVVR